MGSRISRFDGHQAPTGEIIALVTEIDLPAGELAAKAFLVDAAPPAGAAAGPFESFAFDRVYLNAFTACSGPLVFEVEGLRFGLLICEDAWHPSAAYLLARDGADYLLVLSSAPGRGIRSGRELDSIACWVDLCRVTARFQTLYVLYVNRVGVEDGLHFSGGSFVADPSGETDRRAPVLKEKLLLVSLPRGALRRARTRFPLLRDERPEVVLAGLERILRRGGAVEAPGRVAAAAAFPGLPPPGEGRTG